MDRATQDYYESLIDMFATEGWANFKVDFSDSLRMLIENAYKDCPTSEDWLKRRGEIEQLSRVIGFEDLIKQEYENQSKNDSV